MKWYQDVINNMDDVGKKRKEYELSQGRLHASLGGLVNKLYNAKVLPTYSNLLDAHISKKNKTTSEIVLVFSYYDGEWATVGVRVPYSVFTSGEDSIVEYMKQENIRIN